MFRKGNRVNPNYLTVRERIALKHLIKNSRTSNTELSNILKITPQVAGRIRRKLKKEGFIKNYSLDLDYQSMGIRSFSLVLFEMESSYEQKIMSDHLISFYKILTNSATHIALYAFKTPEETNDYFQSLHNKYADHIKIREIHTFPLKGLIKHSSKDLFNSIIKEFNNTRYNPAKSNFPKPIIRKEKEALKNLTSNEKTVLKHFIKDPRIPCGRISQELNNSEITRSGVNRIKQRLEHRQIINGYDLKLNYEKFGVNILSFVFVSKRPGYWKLIKQVENCVKVHPNIIGCYRLNEDGMDAFFCGFRNIKELEMLCNFVQTQTPNLLKVKHIYVMSPSGELKDSSADLFLSLL